MEEEKPWEEHPEQDEDEELGDNPEEDEDEDDDHDEEDEDEDEDHGQGEVLQPAYPAAAAVGEKVAEEPTKPCMVCTFLNYASARRCTMCRTPLDGASAAQSAQESSKPCPICTSFNDSAAGSCTVCGSLLIEAEKACQQCTFLNKSSDRACAMCKHPMIDDGAAGSSSVVEVEVAAAAAPAVPPESFICPLCATEFESSDEGYYELQYCRHCFCRACIVEYVGRSLSLSEVELAGLGCPVPSCGYTLTRQDIRVTAGVSVLHQLDKVVLEKLAGKSESSFFTTVEMLRSAYDALMDVKVSRRPRKTKKRSRRHPEAEEHLEESPKACSGTNEEESTVLDMLRRLQEEVRQLGDCLPYSAAVLLCSDPSVWNVLCWLLRNDSTLDITEHSEVYFQAFGFFRAVSNKPEVYPLLVAEGGGDLWKEEVKPGCLMSLFEKLHKQASFILVNNLESGAALQDTDENSAVEAALLSEAKYLYEDLQNRIWSWKLELAGFSWLPDADEYFHRKFPGVFLSSSGSSSSGSSDTADKGKQPVLSDETESEYLRALKAVQFGQAAMLQNHYFREKINWDSSDVKRSRRISKEIAGLATNLPLELHSSIHVRVDECRMDMLRALIIGPHGTPYQDGVFLFDIFMDESYPSSPPSVQYLTTAGGTVRFNPNLYDCGKVCLSLLNTWSGPRWQSGSSTVLQVLVSLQSLVFVNEPFYNEPGYSRKRHRKESEDYNREQMYNTLMDSMLPALTQPDPAFEGVIEAHFRLKRKAIEEQCDAWSKLEMPQHFSTRRRHGTVNASLVDAAAAVKSAIAARFDETPAAAAAASS